MASHEQLLCESQPAAPRCESQAIGTFPVVVVSTYHASPSPMSIISWTSNCEDLVRWGDIWTTPLPTAYLCRRNSGDRIVSKIRGVSGSIPCLWGVRYL